MLLEAMRLSMIDHEDHQRKMHDDAKRGGVSTGNSGASTPREFGGLGGGSGYGASGSGSGSGSGGIFRKRAGTEGSNTSGKDRSAASKLLSKLGNRSRSNSAASKNGETGSNHRVSFADQQRPNPSQLSLGSGSGQESNSPRVRPSASTGAGGSSSSLISASASGSPALDNQTSTLPASTPASPSSPLNPRHSISSSFSAAPPVATMADSLPTPVMERPEPEVEVPDEHLPRLSADMAPLRPDRVGVPTVMAEGSAMGSKRTSVSSARHVERTA